MIRIREWIEKYQVKLVEGINNPPATPPPQLMGPPAPPGPSPPPGPPPPPPPGSGPPGPFPSPSPQPPPSPNKRDTPDSSRDDQRGSKRQIRAGQFDQMEQYVPSTPLSMGSRNDRKAFEEHKTEDHDGDLNVEDDEMEIDWSDCASEVADVPVPPIYVKLLTFPRGRISPVAFVMKMSCIIIWYSSRTCVAYI